MYWLYKPTPYFVPQNLVQNGLYHVYSNWTQLKTNIIAINKLSFIRLH